MAKKLTPKQRVLKMFPNAECINPAKRYWWVHRNAWPRARQLDGRMLGFGTTAAAAWANALKMVRPSSTTTDADKEVK